jgi:hypothetical protein
MNWAKFDPWFTIRMILHGWHPNSPLSHLALTKKAFFSDDVSDSYLLKFQQQVNRYESFLWPLGMLRPFTSATNVLQQISSSGSGSGEKVLVMSGTGDRMMTISVMNELASTYRQAWSRLVTSKKIESKSTETKPLAGDGGRDSIGRGVRQCFVPAAGHHLQNDVQWKVGAEKLLQFCEQL